MIDTYTLTTAERVIKMEIILFSSLIIIGVITTLTIISVRKGVSGIKLMLFGISITLIGGIIAIDPNSNFGGFEYLIVFIGFIISIIGLGKKD